MESTTIVALLALAYGVFIGYCAGRAQGYTKGAEMAVKIYRK
jgi:hypothetical protein